MASQQIPNLPAAIALSGTEQLEAVQAGTSVKVNVAQLGTYIYTAYPPNYFDDLTLTGNLTVLGETSIGSSLTVGTSAAIGTSLTVAGVAITADGIPPGCAVSTSVAGVTQVSSPILSPYLRIAEVGTDGSGQVTIKTYGAHGLQNGDLVSTCLGGYDGTTWRAHPGNVTSAAVAYIDANRVSLVGTVAVANSAFWHGLMWRAADNTTGYAATLNTLSLALEEAGGGIIEFPAGYIGLETQLWFRNNVIFVGQGKNATNFVSIDGNETHVLREYGMRNHGGRGFTVWGMRQRKNVFGARQAIRAGANGLQTLNFCLSDVGVKGSAGYGIAYQDDALYTNCELDVEVNESDSDCFDIKNRQNTNSGNKINSFRGSNFSLLWIGVDGPTHNFNANPFTTVLGSSIVTVAWTAEVAPYPDVQAYYGPNNRVTFPNAGILNGINMAGTFTIIDRVVGGYRVETGQTATLSSTGGGSGLLEQPALIAQGDAAIDLRGEGWSCTDIRFESFMFTLCGPRFRGGAVYPGNPQGLGAGLSNMTSVHTTNTSEFRTNSIGVGLTAWQCNVPSFVGRNLQEGVFFGTTSRDNIVASAQAVDCDAGAVFRGERNRINSLTAYDTTTAAAVLLGSDHSIGSVKGAGLTVGVHVYPGVTGTQVNDWQGVDADIKVIDAGTASIFIPALPYHQDVYLWAHAVIMAGGETNDTEMGWLNDLIVAEGAAYDLAYEYFPIGVPANTIASLVSLKYRSLSVYTAGATHVPRVGWTGNGTTGAIGTVIQPGAVMAAEGRGHLSSFTIDNVAAGAKVTTGVTGGSGTLKLYSRFTGDLMRGQMLSAAGSFAEPVTTSEGYRSVQRDNTANLSASVDGTALVDIVVGSLSTSPPNNALWILANNNNGALGEPTDSTVSMVCLSRPISGAQNIARAANFLALAQATGAVP